MTKKNKTKNKIWNPEYARGFISKDQAAERQVMLEFTEKDKHVAIAFTDAQLEILRQMITKLQADRSEAAGNNGYIIR